MWQAGNSSLGKWVTANTYQCGNPQQSGVTFTFALAKNGTNCGRNQAQPVGAGSTGAFPLYNGKTYTWTFTYVDGQPNGSGPYMGLDTEAQSIIWQMEPYSGSACGGGLGLGFVNDPHTGAQEWEFTSRLNTSNTVGAYWGYGHGSDYQYSPGETDTWKIVVTVSTSTSGSIALYRNGTLVLTETSLQTIGPGCYPNAWWNFGPYKWRWEISGGGGSDMTSVNATINNMTLTQSP